MKTPQLIDTEELEDKGQGIQPKTNEPALIRVVRLHLEARALIEKPRILDQEVVS